MPVDDHMNWNVFLKATRGKIIVLILVVLILGIPATRYSCLGYVQTESPPPCVERFGFYSTVIILFETFFQALDVVTGFDINYFYLVGYLVILYLAISAVFYIYKKKS